MGDKALLPRLQPPALPKQNWETEDISINAKTDTGVRSGSSGAASPPLRQKGHQHALLCHERRLSLFLLYLISKQPPEKLSCNYLVMSQANKTLTYFLLKLPPLLFLTFEILTFYSVRAADPTHNPSCRPSLLRTLLPSV